LIRWEEIYLIKLTELSKETPPVIISSMIRFGSTLLSRVLSAHPDINIEQREFAFEDKFKSFLKEDIKLLDAYPSFIKKSYRSNKYHKD